MVMDIARRRSLAWIAAAMAVPVLARGQHAHHRMPAGLANLGASAAFDHRGALWAAYTEGGFVLVARSDDLGRSWSDPVRVNAVPEAIDPGGDARPKIAIGADGEVYVSWTMMLALPYTGEIRFSRSLDMGRTFSVPRRLHSDRQLIAHRFDAMAVDRNGSLFIAWIDKRDATATTGDKLPDFRGASVYFVVSKDGGASFSDDFRLAEHSCECCRIALSAGADGSVRAMWRHIYDPNVRDHAVARIFADGSFGEVQRATFDGWRSDVCPHHGPALSTDGAGRLHAVWFTGAIAGAGVYYGRLDAGGVRMQQRIGDETAAQADLASSGERIAIAWKEFDGQRSQLCGMLSENGGNSWRRVQPRYTAGASDRPQVLVMDNRFFAFWNTRGEPRSLVPLS
jgi:hypothetical protein